MLSVCTPAKINLFLNIRHRRPDGFHEISSVMQAVRIWDRLDVEPHPDGLPELLFSCNVPALEADLDANLVVRAYRLFWQATGLPPLGLQVHLEKEIPTQAGLGGGSSDAAAMLVILNHLSHAGLSAEQLRALGAQLGSDVPFFISGGLALAGGRGEQIEPLPDAAADLPLVIIKPRLLQIETAAAYRQVAAQGRYEAKSPEHLLSALAAMRQKPRHTRDTGLLDSYLLNDFETVLFDVYPMLAEMARSLRQAGIRRPLLSGSGSAMLGFLPDNPAIRQKLDALFPSDQFEVAYTATWNDGLRQVASVPEPAVQAMLSTAGR